MHKKLSRSFLKFISCAFVIMLCSNHLQAQTAKDTTDKIEKIFARYKPQNPGA